MTLAEKMAAMRVAAQEKKRQDAIEKEQRRQKCVKARAARGPLVSRPVAPKPPKPTRERCPTMILTPSHVLDSKGQLRCGASGVYHGSCIRDGGGQRAAEEVQAQRPSMPKVATSDALAQAMALSSSPELVAPRFVLDEEQGSIDAQAPLAIDFAGHTSTFVQPAPEVDAVAGASRGAPKSLVAEAEADAVDLPEQERDQVMEEGEHVCTIPALARPVQDERAQQEQTEGLKRKGGRPKKRKPTGASGIVVELKGSGLGGRGQNTTATLLAFRASKAQLAEPNQAGSSLAPVNEQLEESDAVRGGLTEGAVAAEYEHEQALLEREGVVCADQWERLELRCVLSFQPLTDPAKGSHCLHRACCNYKELRDYAGRVTTGRKHRRKQCPLATCGARLQRTRDVERDADLKALLEKVPPSTTAIWLRGKELRTSSPPQLTEAPPERTIEMDVSRKRKERPTGPEPERRSMRRNIIVL